MLKKYFSFVIRPIFAFFVLMQFVVPGYVAGDVVKEIPDVIISMKETANRAIVVEKETQMLYLYEYEGAYKKRFQYKCSTGKIPGAKKVSGDAKTPEGVYFFTDHYPDKDLTPIYGSRALPIDYPNRIDVSSKRTGSAIWLHGINKVLKDRDSNGCIELTNEDIDELIAYIKIDKTPIIITKRLNLVPVEEASREKGRVEAFIKSWGQALKSGSYHKYLSYYDEGFLPDMSWWMTWRDNGAQINDLEIDFNGMSIYQYHGIIVVFFDQVVKSGNHDVYGGQKKIYLTEKGDSFRIVSQELNVFKPESKKRKVNPLIAASNKIKEIEAQEKLLAIKAEKDNQVSNLVEGWISAWSGGLIDQYAEYYASDFYSMGMDREKWIAYKDSLKAKYDYIKITKENLVIEHNGINSIATFLQTYESDKFSAVGVKRLVLKLEGGRWKIFRETWKES